MDYKNLVIDNYKRFCELEGSDYIASEFALTTILKIVRIFNITEILELGLGIGSISDTVLQYANATNHKINYAGTEKNEFCLQALKKNVHHYSQIDLFDDISFVKDKKFDFLVIDGYDDNLESVAICCKKNAIIYVEGDRQSQTRAIRNTFPKSKHVNVISLSKNKPYAHGASNPNHFVGGGQLIFTNPNFKMNLFWVVEKILTFAINKIRIYKK